jgi:heme/copper-type cytochrome/quinol oxidase subunit 2
MGNSKANLKYIFYFLPIFSFSIFLVMMNISSPLYIGPVGILVVFVLLYIFIVSAFFAIMVTVCWLLSRAKKEVSFSYRRQYYLSSIMGLAPIFLLALHSIGSVGISEVLLVLLLVSLASFYLLRRTKA